MRTIAVVTSCLGLSAGKRYHRAVQERKEKVLSITSVDKRVINNLHFRDFLVFLTVNYLLDCACLVFLVLVLGSFQPR